MTLSAATASHGLNSGTVNLHRQILERCSTCGFVLAITAVGILWTMIALGIWNSSTTTKCISFLQDMAVIIDVWCYYVRQYYDWDMYYGGENWLYANWSKEISWWFHDYNGQMQQLIVLLILAVRISLWVFFIRKHWCGSD